MMRWKNVRLIFHREVRDQLRDRRTLFMIAILPLLLYPALGIGMLELTLLFSEQPRSVVLLGEEHLPTPELLIGNRFNSVWFLIPDNADKLEVIADGQVAKADAEGTGEADERTKRLLAQARVIQRDLPRQQELDRTVRKAKDDWNAKLRVWANAQARGDAPSKPPLEVIEAEIEHQRLSERQREGKRELGRLFSASGMQVLVIIPPELKARLEELNRRVTDHELSATDKVSYPHPEIIYNEADDKSLITYNRVREVLDQWESQILKQQLVLAQLPEEFTHPVEPKPTNLAMDEQRSANIWAKLFPALLVIMSVTGAFYPAIDVGAGEKERGTMETLLICPATRSEIVLGKFLTVMLFSCMTAVLNLLSMGLTGRHMVTKAGGAAMSAIGDLSLPTPTALVWIIVLLVPLASLFSALCLALATFARSSKEGQYYLTPLLMITLGLTVFCISPGVELTPLYSILPVAGPALLLKKVLLAPIASVNSSLWFYVLSVLATSVGYSMLALWWAIDLYQREDVLFREAERVDLRLWLKQVLREKAPVPSFAEAGICFVTIVLLQFAAMKALGLAAANGAVDGWLPISKAQQALLIQQLALIAAPALLMGLILTTSVRRTFRLHWPDAKLCLVAVVLPFVLHPLSLELSASLHWFFPQLPDDMRLRLARLTDPSQPLWAVLLVLAAAPAVCEETAFRGFMLSGFASTGRLWLAVVMSSLAFGIFHMVPQQVFNAFLLGMVIALIAVRGNSILPCMLFHFVWNALMILHGRIGAQWWKDVGGDTVFTRLTEGQLRYHWPALVIASLIAIPLLSWLAQSPTHRTIDPTTPHPATPPGPLAIIHVSHPA